MTDHEDALDVEALRAEVKAEGGIYNMHEDKALAFLDALEQAVRRAEAAKREADVAITQAANWSEDALVLERECDSARAHRDAAEGKVAAVERVVASWMHATVEDCWYSCGKTHGLDVEDACCDDQKAGDCTCGIDYRREQIATALAPDSADDEGEANG